MRSVFLRAVSCVSLGLVACESSTFDPAPASEEFAASASAALDEAGVSYVALGDSIAFGDDGYVPYTSPVRLLPGLFVGYPTAVAWLLGSRSVRNLGCPGETTAHFLDAAAPDNGCQRYKDALPLHVPYRTTQLEAALALLAGNPGVQLVTLNLGANDLLLLEGACARATDRASCIAGALPATTANAARNVGAIARALREAGYTGKLVLLTQYGTRYDDPLEREVLPPYNRALSAAAVAYGAIVADGYAAFASRAAPRGGDACAAGLLIANPDGGASCDLHPSAVGRFALAEAITRALAR